VSYGIYGRGDPITSCGWQQVAALLAEGVRLALLKTVPLLLLVFGESHGTNQPVCVTEYVAATGFLSLWDQR
jgi:hypothetical protein